MKDQKIDTLFSPDTTESTTGFSLSKISVWANSDTPTIQYWIFDPGGKKIAVFEGEENEALAQAAFRGIEKLINAIQNQI